MIMKDKWWHSMAQDRQIMMKFSVFSLWIYRTNFSEWMIGIQRLKIIHQAVEPLRLAIMKSGEAASYLSLQSQMLSSLHGFRWFALLIKEIFNLFSVAFSHMLTFTWVLFQSHIYHITTTTTLLFVANYTSLFPGSHIIIFALYHEQWRQQYNHWLHRLARHGCGSSCQDFGHIHWKRLDIGRSFITSSSIWI